MTDNAPETPLETPLEETPEPPNPILTDRQALIDALATTSFTVDATQPEIIEPNSLLLDTVSFTPGELYGTPLTATYQLQVVLSAWDAASAAREQARAAWEISQALAEYSAGDLRSISALFNLQDGAGNIYPACTVEITSEISND